MAVAWNAVDRSWTFSLWSSVAAAVQVEIVDREAPRTVVLRRDLVAEGARWSTVVFAHEVGDADLYGFRVDGPYDIPAGARCDPAKLLLDPEATLVWFPPDHDRAAAKVRGVDTMGRAPFGVLRCAPPRPRMARGPRHAATDLVIYELHVRGATMSAPHVPAELRGTFAGLIHHVPYLAALGVTAVELLPIHQFDPAEGNYWGYMALAWSALHHAYVAGDDPEGEFVAMVQAFHDAGIEVLLDVVYNHTTEEDEFGPTYHLRGIDNAAYYVVDGDGSYRNDAGCGNVVRAAHPEASRMILDSLRRFADLGVDGFRFDLGSLLGRDVNGNVQRQSALIDEITSFAATRELRLIVEPWDLSSYEIGDGFAGRTWAQWNGPFRDDVRSFLRGEDGKAAAVACRVAGSPDLYGAQPQRSINFITAHDGFTLYDWVSYEHKHNAANGWNNSDGTDDNRSWNCGWEGDDVPTELAAEVLRLRHQQMRSALCVLLLANGTPMLLAGDEWANTQGGNNNAYNQDNATSWLDWERASGYHDLTAFVQRLIALRRLAHGEVRLHGVDAEADLSSSSHSLAWCWGDVYVMVNAWWEPLTFAVHEPGSWSVALAATAQTPVLHAGETAVEIVVEPRSTVVLVRESAPSRDSGERKG